MSQEGKAEGKKAAGLEAQATQSSGVKEDNFEDDVLLYFNNIPEAKLLLKNPSKEEFALVYVDCLQDYPLWVAFLENEQDLAPSYGDDMKLVDADLQGWEVVAVK